MTDQASTAPGRWRYRTKVDLGVSLVTMAVGAFFLYQSILTESIEDDVIGPRLVPNFLSIMMIVLGLLIGISALIYSSKKSTEFAPDSLHGEEPEESFGFRDSDIKRVAGIVFMGFLFLAFFNAFGYLIATFLSLMLMLLLFGNRSVKVIVTLSIVGALIYNYIFMGLMNLHNPGGSIIDLQPYAEMIPVKFIRTFLAF
ncbi:MAG: tripartite tricarboxylate transporter TctB family protein [Desulfobulbia bacterium]